MVAAIGAGGVPYRGQTAMMTKVKNAAMITATVLAAIYVLRRVPATRGLVDTALNG